MKILFLSRWYPFPADNGAKIRINHLLRALAQEHQIDLISFSAKSGSQEHIKPLKVYCESVQTVKYRPFQPKRAKALLGFFSPYPRSVMDTDSAEMHSKVKAAAETKSYDLVIASQVDMAQYAHGLPIPKILEEIELATLFEQSRTKQNFLNKIRRALMWKKWKRYISDTLADFIGGTVVSKPEQQMLKGILRETNCTTPIEVIPNGTDVEFYQGTFGNQKPNTMIFSGALTYYANFDAMDFFLNEVYPIILQNEPNALISITGKLDEVPIDQLPQYPGINFTGYLDDIRPAVAQSWVSVVPLRLGGGTRLKILESLALGTPVVSTTKGAEGLELTPGKDLLIADTPDDFANAVLNIMQNPILRDTLSKNGQNAVVTKYNWQTIGHMLNNFIGLVYS